MVPTAATKRCLLAGALLLILAPSAWGQDIDELDEGVVMEAPFVPGIDPSKWELTLQIGYMNLDQILMEAEGVIVDVENPVEVIFADMELRGESSFTPQVKLNRTFGKKFALENALGFAIGDFLQSAGANQVQWIEEGSNTLTEEETELGSYFMWFHEHSVVYYPRGEGRLQPFVTAGIGTQHYFVDSAYIEGGSTTLGFSYGGGLRVVGDALYSVRLEVRNYHASVDYTPTVQFREDTVNISGDAIIGFPNSRLEDAANLSDQEIEGILRGLDLWEEGTPMDFQPFGGREQYPVAVEDYAKQSYSSLWISLGFVASF